MSEFVEILTKHWGYTKFRDLQEDIIRSVVDGNDTLALMPTGGGKSITFQVPALHMDGICIVVTPLIALMKDQVANLVSKDIKAMAVYSGMTKHEIQVAFDNCAYGGYKFLYISPERLATRLFKERVKLFNVSLIAIDEAHCISQWGYDFRPSYLNISEIRKIIPDAPFLALTATATPKVVEDIVQKLEFNEKRVFKKSFERKNLVYIVRNVEDKYKYLLQTIKKIGGSGVIYLRSRKGTKELSLFLLKNDISADFYHAGLSMEMRDEKQKAWMSGRVKIMVATNAFGMGIDKDNVRYVLHMDLPDSLEAYFQEAGRAGRDGKRAYAVLLANSSDETKLKTRFTKSFPPRDFIKKVYHSLGDFLDIAYDSGKEMMFDFKLFDFTRQYGYEYITCFNALSILSQDGYIELTDEVNNPSRLIFLVNRDSLYDFQILNASFDRLIKLILRSYTGVFNDYIGINEDLLANRLKKTRDELYEMLKALSKRKIINYIPSGNNAKIIFLTERLDPGSLVITRDTYEKKKKMYKDRISSVLSYAFSTSHCRSLMLLSYFGDKSASRCGYCDFCKKRNQLNISEDDFDIILSDLKVILEQKPVRLELLIDSTSFSQEKTIKVIKWLFDQKKLRYLPDKRIEWDRSLF